MWGDAETDRKEQLFDGEVHEQRFRRFRKRQQPLSAATDNSAAEPTDWNRERDEWLASLNALYERISAFLKEYVDGGSIKCDFKDVPLNEENIGAYSAKEMIIHIGRQEITLTPIGTLLIGSKGRVDVVGSAGRSRLVLIDKDATSASSLIKITIVDPNVDPKHPPKPAGKGVKKNIEWTWKIVSSPPAMKFIELNKESFFQVLMEVSNG
jgi:hypothetical protein